MNIMLIDHYAGSERLGMEFRPWYLSREWKKLGHRPVVVAADFSHLRRINPAVSRNFEETDEGGVPFVWVRTGKYRGNGAGRAANMAEFCLALRRGAAMLAEEYRPDAVIASSTYPFDFPAAQKIARLSGGKCYFEIHDLWPLTQIELYGMNPGNPYVRLLQRAEDNAFRNAEKVISVLPDAYKHMEERGFDSGKFVYIPNGVDLSADEGPPPECVGRIGSLREQGKFVVAYVGGFSKANALGELIEAAALVGDRAVFVLAGAGMKKQQIIARSSELGLKNILFFDAVPKNAVQPLLRAADCLYIGAVRCSLYRYGAGMNKLYDYMLSGRPVICGIEASNDPVGRAGCGLTIPPQDARAIAEAILKLKNMTEEERARLGENGRRYVVENHDYALLASRFAQCLQKESENEN